MSTTKATAYLILILAFAYFSILGTGPVKAASGKEVFESKCQICHGPKGEGNGPGAALNPTKPASFRDPKFWQGNMDEKINNAVTKGKGAMVKVDLKPDEVKAVTEYIKQTFKP